MATVIKNSFSEETHPWEKEIPSGATKLFIGTFPTDIRNRKYDFFYCSSTNRFWEVMSEVAKPLNEILDEKDEIKKRKKILVKLKLGLTDMGNKVLRQQGSSRDHSLFPMEFMDILQILKDHPTIVTLIVSGNSQGNSSLSWLGIFCELNNIKFNSKKLNKEETTQIIITDRKINILLGYSTSRLSRIKTEKLIAFYKKTLLN